VLVLFGTVPLRARARAQAERSTATARAFFLIVETSFGSW
jgi:hypothetical protein